MEVTPRVKAWLDKQNVSQECYIVEQDYDDEETRKNNPHIDGFTVNNWDLSKSKEENWIEFIYIPETMKELELTISTNGEIVQDNIVVEEKTQIHTICAEQIYYKQVTYVYYTEEEIGYMRKPFRHEETPSRVEGNCVILTVTNFSGKGKNAYEVMRSYDSKQVESSYVIMFEKKDILSLKEFCYYLDNYQKQFLDNLEDNEYLSMDW